MDSYHLLYELVGMKPIYSTHDQNDIGSLMGALVATNFDVWAEGVGFTYHILLFETGGSNVMYFRAFTENLDSRPNAMIYPRSVSKFGYVSYTIVPWLRRRVEK